MRVLLFVVGRTSLIFYEEKNWQEERRLREAV
jgi:hypothetical protein